MLAPLEQLNAGLADALSDSDCDAAYRLLMRFVVNVNALPAAAGAVWESEELDAWCGKLARLLPDGASFMARGEPVDASAQVYVITELYEVGGHTGVVRDFIRMQPERQHHLLLTDIYQKTDRSAVEKAFASENVHLYWADEEMSLSGRGGWLVAALRYFEKARVFLFTHHEDAVAISAVVASAHKRIFFYHHADHTLSLGLHLPGSTHIDLSAYSLENCRNHLGIENCIYVPLMSSQSLCRDAERRLAEPESVEFVSCSAGNGGKFERPYIYPYAEVVADILSATGGKHVHIGDLSEGYLTRIRSKLADSNIDPGRFVFAGRVPDLAIAMSDYKVSVYLSSFPIGGAKAVIDVMGTGTPVISHSHILSPFLGAECYIYEEACVWRHPSELQEFLKNGTSSWQREQSVKAIDFWRHHYAPEVFKRLLDVPDLKGDVTPPRMSTHKPDALRAVLASSGAGGDFVSLFSKIASLEKQLEKAKNFSVKSIKSLDKCKKRLERAKGENKAIKSSAGWRFINPLFKFGQSIRKRLGGS
jgi:hypothetical protein